MPYGNFTGYEPAEGGALDFSTKDGKKLRLVGSPAEELRRKMDASAFAAPQPANMTPVQPQVAPPPEYTPPNATALTGWLRNEPKPAPSPPPEPAHEEKQAALMAWIRGESPPAKTGNDPSVPEKFQTFDPPQVRPGRTFARAAAETALDAAALPVKAASAAADYVTGNDSPFSSISGKDAAESLEYLISGTDPAEIRREEAFAEGAIPEAQTAGRFTGEMVGGAPLAALTGRVPAAGAILKMTQKQREQRAVEASNYLQMHPEAPVLRDYMKSGYNKLNRELRTGSVSPDSAVKADKLKAVLEDAEKSGLIDKGVVYRGVELPTGVLDHWRQAKAVTNRSFWSTSRKGDVAESFSTMSPREPGHDKAILRIQQKNGGVPVGGYEAEVLQKPGKTWVIHSESKAKDGTPILNLKEVDAPPPGITPAVSFSGRSGPAHGIEFARAPGLFRRLGQEEDPDDE